MNGAQREVTQAELQQDVQRFSGVFAERVAQAVERMTEGADAHRSQQTIRRGLLYVASAFDIATGPIPEVNLLDMLVFVTLCREIFERHWLPEVFGPSGQEMLQALRSSEAEAWELADKLMSEEQELALQAQIEGFRADNPDQVRVEGVRLADFSRMAGQAARARTTRGLLASVRSATKAADQAMLLGERALFWAQRTPFLLRLQARLVVYEVAGAARAQLEETDAVLTHTERLLVRAQELRPMMEQASALTRESAALVREMRLFVEAAEPLRHSLEPLLAGRESKDGTTVTALERMLAQGAQLSEDMERTLSGARALTEESSRAAGPLSAHADALVRRWLLYVALVGVLLSVVFWAGYYIVKRALGA